MIDDKKIEAAANKHIETEYARYNSGKVDDEMICLMGKDSFKEGAKWAINELFKNLWHPAGEEPKQNDSYILYEYGIYKGKSYFRSEVVSEWFNWEAFVLEEKITRWLYIDDLFQKEGCEHD
jgi:hypothetical protein